MERRLDTLAMQRLNAVSMAQLLIQHSPVFIKTYGPGGLATASGRRVKSGRLIRAAALTDLTERDRALLCDGLGLKLIIDLRTAVEAEEKPDPALPGVEYLHLRRT